MIIHGAKEKLLEVFDRTQAAYERWQLALATKKEAQADENAAHCAYLNAKSEWDRALKSCSPGDIGVEDQRSNSTTSKGSPRD